MLNTRTLQIHNDSTEAKRLSSTHNLAELCGILLQFTMCGSSQKGQENVAQFLNPTSPGEISGKESLNRFFGTLLYEVAVSLGWVFDVMTKDEAQSEGFAIASPNIEPESLVMRLILVNFSEKNSGGWFPVIITSMLDDTEAMTVCLENDIVNACSINVRHKLKYGYLMMCETKPKLFQEMNFFSFMYLPQPLPIDCDISTTLSPQSTKETTVQSQDDEEVVAEIRKLQKQLELQVANFRDYENGIAEWYSNFRLGVEEKRAELKEQFDEYCSGFRDTVKSRIKEILQERRVSVTLMEESRLKLKKLDQSILQDFQFVAQTERELCQFPTIDVSFEPSSTFNEYIQPMDLSVSDDDEPQLSDPKQKVKSSCVKDHSEPPNEKKNKPIKIKVRKPKAPPKSTSDNSDSEHDSDDDSAYFDKYVQFFVKNDDLSDDLREELQNVIDLKVSIQIKKHRAEASKMTLMRRKCRNFLVPGCKNISSLPHENRIGLFRAVKKETGWDMIQIQKKCRNHIRYLKGDPNKDKKKDDKSKPKQKKNSKKRSASEAFGENLGEGRDVYLYHPDTNTAVFRGNIGSCRGSEVEVLIEKVAKPYKKFFDGEWCSQQDFKTVSGKLVSELFGDESPKGATIWWAQDCTKLTQDAAKKFKST